MNIFHGPQNVAGMAGLMAAGQRILGYQATAVCHPSPVYGFKADAYIGTGPSGGPVVSAMQALDWALSADVHHVYFGESVLGPSLLDAALRRRLRRRVFYTFLGCDVRDSKARIATDSLSVCHGCWPHGCSANRETALRQAGSSGEPIFVTTPDLLKDVPEAVWLPLPVESRASRSSSLPRAGRELIVFHAPTDPGKKGTAFVEAAVSELRDEGVPILLDRPRVSDQAAVLDAAMRADLVVDQVTSGVYGALAAEIMTAGMPVLAHIDAHARSIYPEDLPIIEADPTTLKATLRRVAGGGIDLARVGALSRDYASRVHGQVAVARQLSSYY